MFCHFSLDLFYCKIILPVELTSYLILNDLNISIIKWKINTLEWKTPNSPTFVDHRVSQNKLVLIYCNMYATLP